MNKMVTILSFILVLFSCKTVPSSPKAGNENFNFNTYKSLTLSQEEIDFYNFYSEAFNGQVLIKVTNMLNSPETSSTHISGYHDNSLALSNLLINSNTIPEDVGNQNSFIFDFSRVISGIYGAKSTINFGGVYVGEIESPSIIEASVSSGNIKEGTVLTWNADEYARGVIVYIDFNPNMQFNVDLRSHDPVSFLLQTTDDGEFVLTNEMFEDIPHDAQVSLGVMRGNYKMLTISSGNCRVLVMSCTSGTCVFKP